MVQQDRDLLLKDLCARLPYGVIVRGVFLNYNTDKGKILYEECDKQLNYQDLNRYESLKPYLRQMSSMTEEEEREFDKVFDIELKALEAPEGHTLESAASSAFVIDFYNKYHFDYRGLIPMGLALEAPEGMYMDEM